MSIEEFKMLDAIVVPDERHALLDQITGTHFSLQILHAQLDAMTLIPATPEEIRSQFNVARNLALYTWFSYSLNPIVQLKTYILIEHALKLRLGHDNWPLPKLIRKAISRGLVCDEGFSHLANVEAGSTKYVRNMIDVLPKLRNQAAHGSNMLSQHAVSHLQICTDWINQIYAEAT
jgi:hypothetical protein